MLSEHIVTGRQVEPPAKLIKFKDCRILRNHKISREDLWVRCGKIIDPEKVFFDEKKLAHLVKILVRHFAVTEIMTQIDYFGCNVFSRKLIVIMLSSRLVLLIFKSMVSQVNRVISSKLMISLAKFNGSLD